MSANPARTSATATPPAKVGRPPRVTVQAILDAAIELGLESVTLKQIADHLGIGLATLYRHVSNRDELVRSAAFQLMLARRVPENRDAHWSELALRYAESLFESFYSQPQLISELLRGRLGPHAELDVLENFLAAIGRHGFTPAQGAQLFHAIGMLMIGAAAGHIGLQAAQAAGEPWSLSVRRALVDRDEADLPLARSIFPASLDLSRDHWMPALRNLLAGFATARGEELPAALAAPHNTVAHPAAAKLKRKGRVAG